MHSVEPLQSVHAPLLHLLTPASRALVAARRPVCAGCSQNKGLGQLSVRCEATGCSGVSLLHGRCKRRKWPAQPRGRSDTAGACRIPASNPHSRLLNPDASRSNHDSNRANHGSSRANPDARRLNHHSRRGNHDARLVDPAPSRRNPVASPSNHDARRVNPDPRSVQHGLSAIYQGSNPCNPRRDAPTPAIPDARQTGTNPVIDLRGRMMGCDELITKRPTAGVPGGGGSGSLGRYAVQT